MTSIEVKKLTRILRIRISGSHSGKQTRSETKTNKLYVKFTTTSLRSTIIGGGGGGGRESCKLKGIVDIFK